MGQLKVVLITTGGTISTFDKGRGAVVARDGAQLLRTLGAERRSLRVKVIDFARIPGCQMTPELMAKLSERIARELRGAEVAGAVVTHGTDTIEETAFFMHLTVASAKPVVFTGSMRTGSDLAWDGPRNLLDAIKVARWPRARGLGALLVMNEEIHSARFVTKGDGLTVSTFHSPACGPVGRIYNGEPMLLTVPALTRAMVAPHVDDNVAMVTAAPGERWALDEALARGGLRGMVIAGFGSGRVPFGWIGSIKRAVEGGLPVVLASRTGAGAIDDPYGYGGAHFLRAMELIAAHELPAHKARIKLMVALGNRMRGAKLRRYFEEEDTEGRTAVRPYGRGRGG